MIERQFIEDCSICLHEAGHLVLRFVLTGSTLHSATVDREGKNQGHVMDPDIGTKIQQSVWYSSLNRKDRQSSEWQAVRRRVEQSNVASLAGREAERKMFPFLGPSYGSDGKMVRMVLANLEPDPKKQRKLFRDCIVQSRAAVDKWWPFIVMTAIILQVKRTLDRKTIYRIIDFIIEKTDVNPYEDLGKGG